MTIVPLDRFIRFMESEPSVPDTPVIWTLLDDRAGNRSQCLGVANVLGRQYLVKEVRYSVFARLPNAVLGASLLGLAPESRLGFQPPWPDMVIAAGRRTGPIARAIKAKSKGRTKLVQIMYPGATGVDEFDLIAMPTHDEPVSGSNILPILGAPHGITEDILSEARDDWQDSVSSLPTPRIAVLIGGSTRRRSFTPAMARELGGLVNAMATASGGSLMISTSRRTGKTAEAAFMDQVTVAHTAFRWGEQGANPYRGYLALADGIVVTGDSVSMCSEVCGTEAPVYIYAPTALITEKHGRLHKMLYEDGYARPLTGAWSEWHHPRLNSATEIASEIHRRLLSEEYR